ADNLEVLPQNPEAAVEWFARRLDVEQHLESFMTFVRANTTKAVKSLLEIFVSLAFDLFVAWTFSRFRGACLPAPVCLRKPFPAPCKVHTALSIYCDLCAAPQRSVAKKFAPFVRDEAERQELYRLVQDREAYQVLLDGRISLQDFFELFLASADLDISIFLQLCQRQKNRPYTIASSSKEDSSRIGICVSMVQEQTQSLEEVLQKLKQHGFQPPRAASYLQQLGACASQPRRFRGLCSEMLCMRTTRNEKLWIAARASSFRLPKRSTTPIIMLGAGTGLAPFRGFVREFQAEKGSRSRTVLFFGCTKRDEDFIYREELEGAASADPPALKELITAFSREQKEKIYVQHRLKERGEE
ncbi:unnamed protein product, partial [Effrenium voratum]